MFDRIIATEGTGPDAAPATGSPALDCVVFAVVMAVTMGAAAFGSQALGELLRDDDSPRR